MQVAFLIYELWPVVDSGALFSNKMASFLCSWNTGNACVIQFKELVIRRSIFFISWYSSSFVLFISECSLEVSVKER